MVGSRKSSRKKFDHGGWFELASRFRIPIRSAKDRLLGAQAARCCSQYFQLFSRCFVAVVLREFFLSFPNRSQLVDHLGEGEGWQCSIDPFFPEFRPNRSSTLGRQIFPIFGYGFDSHRPLQSSCFPVTT
jgi:hypothetical protein